MKGIFLNILNMDAAAAVVISAVLCARLLLRRAPKKYSYLLWTAVGFRLCCPFSLKSALSLFRLPGVRAIQGTAQQVSRLELIEPVWTQMSPPVPLPSGPEAAVPSVPAPVLPAEPDIDWIMVGAWVWLTGLAVLLVWNLTAELHLRRRLSTAVWLEENVYRSEAVRSPFVLGLFRPKIYIPYGLKGESLHCVLAHERFHLRRGDPLLRRLALFLLLLHWFDPLCWLAFHLMGRDMELSCDEGVLRETDIDPVLYSRVLLAFAMGRQYMAAGMIAFGESGVSARIKNALNWKKQRVWKQTAALLVCLLAVGSCMANPAEASLDLNRTGMYTEFWKVMPRVDPYRSYWQLLEQPVPESTVIAELPPSTWAVVLEERPDGWRRVIAGERIGWQKPFGPEQTDGELRRSLPVPEFLPEELQILYAKAALMFDMYAPFIRNENGWNGYADYNHAPDPGRGTGLAKEMLYPEQKELKAALERVFTPEFVRERFDPEENWTEVGGQLYGRRETGEDMSAEITGFVLHEKTEKRIRFDLLLRQEAGRESSCAMPVELVSTRNGWRVNAFSTPSDSVHWLAEMAVSDPAEPQATGELRREVVAYEGGRTITEYGPDGQPVREETRSEEDRLNTVTIWQYDDRGTLLYQRLARFAPDGTRNEEVLAPDGTVLEHSTADPDGRQIARQVFEWDENGRQSVITVYADHDSPEYTEYYSYDSQGNLIGRQQLNADGSERELWLWQYDGQGRRRSEELRKDGRRSVVRYDDKSRTIRKEAYVQDELEQYIEYEYDGGWNWTEERTFRADGSLEQRVQRSYDGNGQLTKELILNEN